MKTNKIKELNQKDTYSTRREQVDASVRFVMQNEAALYNGMGENLPKAVEQAVLIMVFDWPKLEGYHYRVLRAAARQFNRGPGFMGVDEPPFSMKDLYED